jgi:mono/diheme cytochrome c family protein
MAATAALLLAGPARAGDPPAKSPELLARGKAAFAKYCASCHGPRGEGDGVAAKALKTKPRNLTTEPLKIPGAAGVFETLTSGVKGTQMVAFKHLSEEDRWALSYFVVGLKDEAVKK